MSFWHLVIREILYRKLNFVLALFSVVAAVGCLVASLTLLHKHDLQTELILAQKEAETTADVERIQKETEAKVQVLKDDYRKITRTLGFNVLILPKDQKVSDFLSDDFATKYMPDDYADRLAKSSVVTVNHLLPILQQKLLWPEHKRTIILTGVRGEVPILHADPKKPLQPPVKKGGVVVGHELHNDLGLKVGDKVKLLNEEFTVEQLHPPRGNKDDITLWIDLKMAQKLLDREGKINAILALECNCEANRFEKVVEEVTEILDDTQVIEFASPAKTRADARNRAEAEGKDRLEKTAAQGAALVAKEKAGRAQLRSEQEKFAHGLAPLVLAGSIVWVGLLAFNNVRERRTEIGILRALGLGNGQVYGLFLVKAVLVGLLGAAIGFIPGLLIGLKWGETSVSATALFNPWLLVVVLLAAPLLCALASWIPAILAARQDPAVVLREE